MRFTMSLLPLIFLAVPAHADKFAYPPQKISAEGIQEIKISGVKGRLVLNGRSSKTYKIKVSHSKNKRFEDWSLSVDRQGDSLVLEVFNVALGSQWRHSVRAELYPEFDIELEGPAVPTVISWREGQMSVSRWDSDVEASYLNGKFEADRMHGNLKVQAGDGRLKISNFEGTMTLKGEKGRVELSSVKGKVDLNWLQGVLRGEDLGGTLNLELPSGNASLKGVTGKLKATGGNSEWMVEGTAPGDLEVVTDSGPVKIRWKGGAKLFLTSNTGAISVPKPFAVETREGLKVVEGVREKNPRGQVFVRTQSGAISWQ
jgi:hypothetical protein